MLELLLFLIRLINSYIIAFQKEDWDLMEVITTLKEFIIITSAFIYKRRTESNVKENLLGISGDPDQDFEDVVNVLRSKDTINYYF